MAEDGAEKRVPVVCLLTLIVLNNEQDDAIESRLLVWFLLSLS